MRYRSSSKLVKGLGDSEIDPKTDGDHYLAPRLGAQHVACAILFVHMTLVLFSFVKFASGETEWGFALVGTACSAIVAAPFLDRRVGFLSIWGVLWLVVLFGAGFRGVMISARLPGPDVIDSLFLLGRSFEELQFAAFVTIVGIALLTSGYYFSVVVSLNNNATGTSQKIRWLGPDVRIIRPVVMYSVIAIYAAVGAIATARYSIAVGGLSASISERRTVFTGAANYESYGLEKFFASAGVVALMLFLAYRLQAKGKLGLTGWIAGATLIANAFAINVVTTARSDLLFVTIGLLMVVYTVKKSIPIIGVLVASISVVTAIATLSADRGGQDVAQGDLLVFGVESGLLNRNAFDLSKSLQIIDAVPWLLSYEKGATIYTYVLAPIPRVLWPDKPMVSPGPIIGDRIYGLLNTGVPPGMIAELVWNFGFVIALAIIPVIGILLGRLEGWALSYSRFDVVFLLFYASVLLPFGKALIGVAIGQAFSSSLQAAALLMPAAIALLIIYRRGPAVDRDRDAPVVGGRVLRAN